MCVDVTTALCARTTTTTSAIVLSVADRHRLLLMVVVVVVVSAIDKQCESEQCANKQQSMVRNHWESRDTIVCAQRVSMSVSVSVCVLYVCMCSV